MKAYKVVRVVNGVRESFVSSLPKEFNQKYEINCWVKPKVGKFFAFNSYEDALNFLKREGVWLGQYYEKYFEIWLVEIEGKSRPKQNILRPFDCSLGDFYSFWENKNKAVYTRGTPVGSIFCSKLKLVKKMKDFQYDWI